MKILHVMPSFHPAVVYGGPIASVFSLCRELGKLGHEIRVLTTNANGRRVLEVDPDRDVEVSPGVSVRYCRRIWREAISPTLVRLLPRYTRWAEVVHVTSVYSFATIPALVTAAAARRPLVWSPRGSLAEWAVARRATEKLLFDRACRLVAPERVALHVTSSDEEQASARRFPGWPLRVIPNGVDIPPAVLRSAPGETLRLLFLGRLHPVKALENLIDAIALLLGEGRRIVLTIAGDGASDYVSGLHRRVEWHGTTGAVSFVGAVYGDEKRALLARSDVLILPSHSENFGMVVAEALAHGVPVVASRGTPWRRLEDEGCGLWVENRPQGLAGALARLASRSLPEMGARGRTWMIREFGWLRRAEELADLYEFVAARSCREAA